MFGFGDDEEDETTAPQVPQLEPWKQALLAKRNVQVGPQVAQANPNVVQRKIDEIPVAETYDAIKADDSKIDAAKEAADDDNFTTSMFQGLSTAFAGPKYTNDGFYDGLRKRSDGKVDAARADKQELIKNYLQKNELQRQGIKDGQDATMFGLNTQKAGLDIQKGQGDNAKHLPDSKVSITYKPITAKMLGIPVSQLDGVSYEDQLKMVAARTAWVNANSSGRSGPVKLERVNVTDPVTKKTKVRAWNPHTNEMTIIKQKNPTTGEMEEVDPDAGYAPTIVDGNVVNRTEGTSAPVINSDGRTLPQVINEQKGNNATTVDLAQAGVKADVEVADAEAAKDNFYVVKQQFDDLVPPAELAGDTGWVKGRLKAWAAKNNVSESQAAATITALRVREGAKYIRAVSGLATTDPEYQRLLQTMPDPLQPGEDYAGRMAAWQYDVENFVALKKAKADKIKELQQKNKTANQPAVAPQTRAPTPPATTVRMTDPSGKVFNVPADKVEAAKAKGWK